MSRSQFPPSGDLPKIPGRSPDERAHQRPIKEDSPLQQARAHFVPSKRLMGKAMFSKTHTELMTKQIEIGSKLISQAPCLSQATFDEYVAPLLKKMDVKELEQLGDDLANSRALQGAISSLAKSSLDEKIIGRVLGDVLTFDRSKVVAFQQLLELHGHYYAFFQRTQLPDSDYESLFISMYREAFNPKNKPDAVVGEYHHILDHFALGNFNNALIKHCLQSMAGYDIGNLQKLSARLALHTQALPLLPVTFTSQEELRFFTSIETFAGNYGEEGLAHYAQFISQVATLQGQRPMIFALGRDPEAIDVEGNRIALTGYGDGYALLAPFIEPMIDCTLFRNAQLAHDGLEAFYHRPGEMTQRNIQSLKSRDRNHPGTSLANELHANIFLSDDPNKQYNNQGVLELYITDPRTMESISIRKKLPFPVGISEQTAKLYTEFLYEVINIGSYEKAARIFENKLNEYEIETLQEPFTRFSAEIDAELTHGLFDFNATANLPRRAFSLNKAGVAAFIQNPSDQNAIAAIQEKSIFKLNDGRLSLLPQEHPVGRLKREQLADLQATFLQGEEQEIEISLYPYQGAAAIKLSSKVVDYAGGSYIQLLTTVTSDNGRPINRTTLYPIEGQGNEAVDNTKIRVMESHLLERDLLLAIADWYQHNY